MHEDREKKGRCDRCGLEKMLAFCGEGYDGIEPGGEWLCQRCIPTLRPKSMKYTSPEWIMFDVVKSA